MMYDRNERSHGHADVIHRHHEERTRRRGVAARRSGDRRDRATIARVAEASGGNPFFAIEIARAIATDVGVRGDHGPLPVPHSVHRLAAERDSALSSVAREAEREGCCAVGVL